MCFISDYGSGFYSVNGAASVTDLFYYVATSPSASIIGWKFNTLSTTPGAIDTDFRVPGDKGSVTVGPNRSGVFSDSVNANIYLSALVRQVDIGPPGVLATNGTAQFLGLGTCAGTPTGVPAGASTGKTYMVFDSTAHKLWAYDGGTWRSVTLA